MEDLIVVAYKTKRGAVENLQALHDLSYDWIVNIHDAVAVARDAKGALHVQDSYKPTTGAGLGWGALIGSIMGGVALTPLTGGLSAVVAAGTIAAGAAGGATLGGLTGGAVAATEKEHHGISEAFVTEVADAIDCGESALFALIETEDPDWAVQYFRGTGGKIIRTNLSPSERERVQQILSGED